MQASLIKAVQSFGDSGQHVLVIGDVMLDRYLIGDVNRISPEAPVPVVLLRQQNDRIGGAGNVAANLAALGIKAHLLACIGDDGDGQQLVKLLQTKAINTEALLISQARPTISKTRVLGGHQQMMRIDQESASAFSPSEAQQIIDQFTAQLALKPAIIILSDYAKGLLSEPVCQHIIQAARAVNVPVLVDPKGRDYNKYRQATALTPNKKEIAEACAVQINDPDLLSKAAALKTSLQLDFLAVTRGEEGITLIDGNMHHLQATAKQVFDVSGAGDTVIATLAAGLMHGFTPLNSLDLANIAAGVVVGQVGTVPITKHDLMQGLLSQQSNEQANKICTLSELIGKVELWKQSQQTIVFTNGCFDLLHAGHVTYLEAAKKRGDKLILGLNTDRSVSAIKGPSRPVVHERDRARVLAALESVDAVILFDEETPLALINAIKPHIIAKGSDYAAEQVVGGKEVKSWGGEIALIDLVEGKSTSNLIQKMNR